jgi:hypothetical protein
MNALGRMVQRQGRHEEALACFAEATRMAPANEHVQASVRRSLNRYIGNIGYPFAALMLLRLLAAVSPALAIGVLVAGAGYMITSRRARLAQLKERAPILHTLYHYRGRRSRPRRLIVRIVILGIVILGLSLIVLGLLLIATHA